MAPEELLVVVFRLVLLRMRNDRVLLKLLQNGVPARERKYIALLLQTRALGQAESAQQTHGRATCLVTDNHVHPCGRVFQFQLLQAGSVILELFEVQCTHRLDVE